MSGVNIYIRFAKRTRAAEVDVASVLSADQIAAAETVAGMLAKGGEVVIQLPVTDNFDQLARATLKAVFEAMPENKRTGVSFATGLTSTDISRKGGDVSLIITDKSQQQTGEGKRWIDLSETDTIAVADMLSKKTGQRYSLDTDALRGQQENRVRYMVDTTVGEGLLEPISDQRFQQLSAKNDNTYLVTNRTDLEKHVRSALTGDKKANIEIGVLPRDAAIKINEDIPNLPASFNGMLLRPYLQYAVEVSYDSMRHLRNEHGFTENEVVDYVLRIPDVLRNHDSVHFSWFEMHDGRQAGIRFKSSIPNGFNVVYELVSKKRNVLQLKTDYEKVIGPVYPAKSQMRSGVTSETASILALNDSLADSQKKSNTPAEHSLDEEYLDLAEKYKSGTATKAETEQLRKAVDQAARKAGYTTKAYHGTTADFTKFDKSKIGSATDEGVYGRGFYFSTSRQQSEQYSKGKAPMEVFLNTGNQLLLNDHSSVEELADLLNMSESNLTQDRSTGVVRPLYSQVNQFAAHVQEAGYDSVRADYGASDEIVMFDSDRIKSADPVTYDEKGNIIPLSERFNAKNKDIRYSIDDDTIRQAFTVIDTAGIEDGLEALKDGVRVTGQMHGPDAEKPVDIEKDHTQNELRRRRGFRPVERHSTAG